MAVLPIFLILATTISAEHTQFLISQLSTHLVGPPFFQNVTTEGKIGFYKVLNNKTLTRNQQREMLIKWGEENEVEAPVRGYIDKQARSLHEFRENINLFLMQLLDYEKEIDSIYFDDNLTVEQREHLLFTLDCPAPMKKILSYAATAVKRYGLPQRKRTSRAPTTTAYRGSATVAPTAGNNTAKPNTTVTSTTPAGNTTASGGNVTTITTNATIIPTTSSNITAAVTVITTTAAGNISTTVMTAATAARAVPSVTVTTVKVTNVTTPTPSSTTTTPTTTSTSTVAPTPRVMQNRG